MLKIGNQICMRIFAANHVKSSVGKVIVKESLTSLNVQSVRNTSFFNRLTQDQLWKGVLSVSNAGKRRGRGNTARKRGRRDLNEGQVIGIGKIGMQWPGLNYNILGEEGIGKIQKLPEGHKVSAPVPRGQKQLRKKTHPLERGWTATQWSGRRVGPPVPIQDETFDDFESIILDIKMRVCMTSTLGRQRKFDALVATGNGNGLIGVGVAKGLDKKSCVDLAKRRASRRLLSVNLIDKRVVNHDFFAEYGRTRLTVLKQPEGYGLRCHRIIIALCKLIGIENLYAKVEGSINAKYIVRAFIYGLLKQKTYQEIADEKNMHLVEFREETLNFPQLLASPEKCLTPEEARRENVLFQEYIMGGKLIYDRGERKPFYTRLPSWTKHLKRTLYKRNHNKVKLELFVKYGKLSSHLTEVYPECKRNEHSTTLF